MYPMVGLLLVGMMLSGSNKNRCPMGKPYCIEVHQGIGGRMGGPLALTHRTPISECGLLPWLPEKVDSAIEEAWSHDVRRSSDLTKAALMSVYPVTPEGNVIEWPAVPGDCTTLKAIEARVHYRADFIRAARDDAAAEKAWYEGGGR